MEESNSYGVECVITEPGKFVIHLEKRVHIHNKENDFVLHFTVTVTFGWHNKLCLLIGLLYTHAYCL